MEILILNKLYLLEQYGLIYLFYNSEYFFIFTNYFFFDLFDFIIDFGNFEISVLNFNFRNLNINDVYSLNFPKLYLIFNLLDHNKFLFNLDWVYLNKLFFFSDFELKNFLNFFFFMSI